MAQKIFMTSRDLSQPTLKDPKFSKKIVIALVFSAMQMSDRIPNVVCSHQHDHHMNKHIVRVVPCPECINRSLHINRYAPEQVYIESSKHEAKRKRH